MSLPDLRPQLAESQEWVATLIGLVRDDQWDLPTPCDDYTVADLTRHVLAVQQRIRTLAIEGNVDDAPVLLDLTDDPVARFRELAASARDAWADDAVMRTLVHPPWGEVPGAAAVGGYLQENLTHGWDLATACGQPSEADPLLAAPVAAAAKQFVPAEPRGGPIPFGAPVESTPDAGPTEQLANWLGRRSR